MKRLFCTFLLLLAVGTCRANMASPIMHGTRGSLAVTSREIDILREHIDVMLETDEFQARYTVEYHIRSDRQGQQIPLLFIADNYSGNFTVRLDGQPVELTPVGEWQAAYPALRPFAASIVTGEYPRVIVGGTQEELRTIPLQDMHYFEVDLTPGEHLIRVEYLARARVDRSDWVVRYGFDYDLGPARFWRSFGTLTITVRQQGALRDYATTLGPPDEGAIGRENTWTFDRLPGEEFNVTFTPQVARVARVLIAIGPEALAGMAALLLMLLHGIAMIHYRKRHPGKRFSPVWLTGALLVPALMALAYAGSFALIDAAIGPYASDFHGYALLFALFLWPFATIVYGIASWAMDRIWKIRAERGDGKFFREKLSS